jgi:hypothetical protein
MLKTEWIVKNLDTIKRVILAVLSEETAEDVKEMQILIEKGVIIAMDIFREPLKEAGFELEETRGIPPKELLEVKMRLLKLHDSILPYNGDEL